MNEQKALLAFTGVLALAAVGGAVYWSSKDSKAASQPGTKQVVTVTPLDTGKTVQLKAGDVLQVKLPVTASTGFDWVATMNGAGLVLRADRTVEAAGGTPGAPQMATYIFDAAAKGSSSISFYLQRDPADVSTRSPAPPFTLNIVVT